VPRDRFAADIIAAMLATILLFLQVSHATQLNPNAACANVRDKEYCEAILPMIDSVDARASLAELQKLIAKYGWPGEQKVGTPAYNVVMQVMQRASAPQPRAAVARMWRGRVPNARADEYQKYLDESGVQKLRQIPHNLGVQMFRRPYDDKTTEFIVISYWPNRDAIHAYAGADIDKVHDLPRDKEFLIDPEKTVRHYDVVMDVEPRL
jgi:heme-degrading monooxygenase HmoA